MNCIKGVQFFVYPLLVLASGGLLITNMRVFNNPETYGILKRRQAKETLEFAVMFSLIAFLGSVLALSGLLSPIITVYFSISLVLGSVFSKVAVIQTEYKLVSVNVVSEFTLSWGFIACCLLTLYDF